ncbi:MAG: hypothetical protein ABI460_06885 [Caldimonas sp.]
MTQLPRSFALLASLALAAGLLTSCGGGDLERTSNGDGVQAYVFLSPSEVSVAPGQTIEMQIDIADLPAGDSAAGYAISLSEEVTRIRIDTAGCSSGGTPSCQRWTIRPDVDAQPGEYGFDVRASGTFSRVAAGSMKIRVLPPLRIGAAAVMASGNQVVTSTGQMWANGSNEYGQTGVGFESVGFEVDEPFILPDSIESYVTVGSDTDWISVASTGSTVAGGSVIGLKRDGTVWGWGHNPRVDVEQPIYQFGFTSEREIQLRPRQILGLPPIQAISTGGHSVLALARDGTIYAFGGGTDRRYNPNGGAVVAGEPMAVPLSAVTLLGGVVAIAGGVQNTGRGRAVALRDDGSVWQFGRSDAPFFLRQSDLSVVPTAAIPQRVALPSAAVAVTASANFSLAATLDGALWSWTETDPVPRLVAGVSSVVALDSDSQTVAALDAQGVVWLWAFGQTPPRPVEGVPRMARLANGAPRFAISAGCTPDRGSLWQLKNLPYNEPTSGRRVPGFAGRSDDGCPDFTFVTLTLAKTGSGTVSIDPLLGSAEVGFLGLCDTTCAGPLVVAGAILQRGGVRVRATPAPGWQLDGFNPECADGAPALDVDTTCTARFVPAERIGLLSVSVSGSGRISSTPAGIDCGSDCNELYALGTEIRLTAIADPGYAFIGWSGPSNTNQRDCSDGTVTMNVVGKIVPLTTIVDGQEVYDWRTEYPLKHCTATFGPLPRLSVAASAGGRVTSVPAGIDCGAVCSAPFAGGQAVTLSAVANAGYRFDGFFEAGCQAPINLARDLRCTPVFVSTVNALLSVSVSGDGRVTSGDGGIDCNRTGGALSGSCSQSYPVETVVALTPLAAPGWTLASWSGDCVGGSVRLDVARVCTATFVPLGWQQVGPDVQTAGVIRTAMAVDRKNSAAPIIYVATSSLLGQHFDLVVRRFDGVSWSIVGTGPINDPLLSSVDFTPSIAVDGSGKVSVAWAENGDRIRVSQWNGTAWSVLASNLKVDPSATVFGVQLATSGGQLIVGWLETAAGALSSFGQLTLKRYDPAAGWSGGTVALPGPAAVFALRVKADAAGRAMLMFIPAVSPTTFVEAPPRVVREGAPGTWADACAGSLARPAPGNNLRNNVELGFGIARNSADQPVAVFNNGASAFAVECRGGAWTGLDGSAQGEIPGLVMGESLIALAVGQGETDGVALALAKVSYLASGDRQFAAQVLMQGMAGAPLMASQAPLADLNPPLGQLALALANSTSPLLAVPRYDSGSLDVQVYRFFP